MSEQSATMEKQRVIGNFARTPEKFVITDHRGNPEVKLTYTEGPYTATVTGSQAWAVVEEMKDLVEQLHKDKGA